MSWFSNKALNRVYTHGAIQTFAETSGGVFYFVFLLKAGVPLTLVLCTLAAINLGRYALRRLILPLARAIGLRNTLICGTLLESGSYWLVPWVEGVGPVLYALVLVSSIGSVTYWTSYHAYVARTGDSEARGKQTGVIEALAALVGVIAPACMTLLLVFAGPKPAFALVALVQMASAIPLLGLPSRPIALADPDPQVLRRGRRLFFADGWAVGLAYYLWHIALFITLGEEFAIFGGVVVLAGIAGAIMSLLVGRYIDLGQGGRLALFAYGAAACVAFGKAMSVGIPWAAMTATSIAAMVGAVQIPVIMARLYNLAEESGCTLRFNMATEGGWDLGSASACLSASLLISLGVSPATPIALAVPGLLATGLMLRASYQNAR